MTTTRWIALGVLVPCLLNAVAFFVVWCLIYPGTASAGKVEDGVFYLGDHGRYVAVSAQVHAVSLYHGYSLWVTHPLAMIALAVLGFGGAGSGRKTSNGRAESPR